MKLALVHDYLTQQGGAEKVFECMAELWPKASIHTLFLDPHFPLFHDRPIQTSFLQHLPLITSRFQWYLPLMPTAIEQFDFSDADVVLSSTSAFAKGIITRHDTLHVCYCHTPTRYLWSDTHSYVEELRLPRVVKTMIPLMLTNMRVWDRHAADRVDVFIANSETVRARIQKYYRQDAEVIHPPVETERFKLSDKPKTYFLTGGRLVAYKRYDLVIEAANRTGLPLKIFGKGPIESHLRRMAKPHIEFMGYISDSEQAELYANALAFIHPQEEDFGITAVESMAAGRPVIAWRRGGATETIVEGVSGELFDELSWEEIADYLIHFQNDRYQSEKIQVLAQPFSKAHFQERLQEFVEKQSRTAERRSGKTTYAHSC